jgi:hypothetical protein
MYYLSAGGRKQGFSVNVPKWTRLQRCSTPPTEKRGVAWSELKCGKVL